MSYVYVVLFYFFRMSHVQTTFRENPLISWMDAGTGPEVGLRMSTRTL